MVVLIVEVLVKLLIALLNGQLPICPALATSSQRLTPPPSRNLAFGQIYQSKIYFVALRLSGCLHVHSRAKPERSLLLDVSAKPLDLYKVWSFLTIKWRYAPFFKVPRIAILVPFGY